MDDNFVADKIKDLMAIQGEIGLTVKVGLFTGTMKHYNKKTEKKLPTQRFGMQL